jgi:hypothetical protein
MTAPADPAQLDLVTRPMARVGNSGASSAPHIHIQAQTLPPGIADHDDRRSAAAEDPAHLSVAVPRGQPGPGSNKFLADSR